MGILRPHILGMERSHPWWPAWGRLFACEPASANGPSASRRPASDIARGAMAQPTRLSGLPPFFSPCVWLYVGLGEAASFSDGLVRHPKRFAKPAEDIL